MHMADALLSPAVGITMTAVSVAAIGWSVDKLKKYDLSEKMAPLMGVAGALVFAGQMINFTIPATGSSGHIGGGMLLSGLLGGVPAFIAITAVLVIQCLFFADGGLLALGCNIFNMGVIPCLIIYPLVFKPILRRGIEYKSLSVASVLAVVIGLELGAFCVVLQTFFSGITVLPINTFLFLMLPIHLAIGIIEGIVTAAILCFVYNVRPEIIDSAQSGRYPGGILTKKLLVAFVTLTIIVGGFMSLFASSHPDGLEWAVARTTEQVFGVGTEPLAEGGLFDVAAIFREKVAFLPDYAFKSDPGNVAGTSLSGILGAAITFILAGATGFFITKMKKIKKVGANV